MNKKNNKDDESLKILLASYSNDQQDESSCSSTKNKNLWLIAETGKQDDDTTNVILTEANTKLETTSCQTLHSIFPKGYNKTNITNLIQLRNALNQAIPPDSIDTTLQKTTATPQEMNRFELFRSVITHEDELLNHRVSWIILAQSFLMAAYITATDASNATRCITATVGLLTVIVTLPAILAAGSNVDVQQQVYFRQIKSDERCMQLHGHTRDLSVKPTPREERVRLEHGHVLPNMAFRGRSAVRILYTAIFLAGVQILGWAFLLAAVIHEWE